MAPNRANGDRLGVFEDGRKAGWSFASYVSSKATTFSDFSAGENCFILEDNTVQPFVRIGDNVMMWSGNHIGHHSVVGDHVFIASHVVVSGHCDLESRCYLGVNSTLRDGSRIGEGSMVAMGANVVTDTAPYSVNIGNPAKPTGADAHDLETVRPLQVFGAADLGPDALSHAALPTPVPLDEHTVRVFVSSRNGSGESLPYAVDIDIDTFDIVGNQRRPLMVLGARGTFDENGIMPSSVVRLGDGSFRMYYIGWNRGSSTVPYRLAIGSARSADGLHFERESDGPVLDRSRADPIFVTAPDVVPTAHGPNEEWTMTYVTTSAWELVDGRPEPRYHLASATSNDGLDWTPSGPMTVSLDAEAFGRPSRYRHGADELLLCCHRGMNGYRSGGPAAYRIGVLHGSERAGWTTVTRDLAIEGDAAWASEMRCYPRLVQRLDHFVMLYNGDGFGRTGVLAARFDPARIGVPS